MSSLFSLRLHFSPSSEWLSPFVSSVRLLPASCAVCHLCDCPPPSRECAREGRPLLAIGLSAAPLLAVTATFAGLQLKELKCGGLAGIAQQVVSRACAPPGGRLSRALCGNTTFLRVVAKTDRISQIPCDLVGKTHILVADRPGFEFWLCPSPVCVPRQVTKQLIAAFPFLQHGCMWARYR